MSIVRVEHISRIFSNGDIEVRALNDVSITIEKGEFTAMVGPSGSGKTTLLNQIGGLDQPTSGEIWIGDQALHNASRSELTALRLWKIGFIFQEYNLIPVLTTLENVEYVMLLQKIPTAQRRERALQVLHEVGLEGLEERRPRELSGGQQQRVAVARAIVTQPDIILADEPTANLDSKTGAALLDMMRNLNQTHGITFLFSTHDPMVMQRATRIITLKDGALWRDEVIASEVA